MPEQVLKVIGDDGLAHDIGIKEDDGSYSVAAADQKARDLLIEIKDILIELKRTNQKNFYGETYIPPNMNGKIVDFTVPNGFDYYITGFNAQGDIDGEFFLKINGEIKASLRTSPSNRTSQIGFSNGAVVAISNNIVELYGKHYGETSATLKGSFFGYLIKK